MFDNSVTPILPSSGLLVSTYSPDVTTPFIESFSLNMQTSTLIITFSESATLQDIDLSNIFLTSHRDKRYGSTIHLGDGTASVGELSNAIYLTVTLPSSSTNFMKVNNIGKSVNETFLTITKGAVKDGALLEVDRILDDSIVGYSPMRPSEYSPDTTNPSLSSFKVDHSSKSLHLFFSEAVNISTLNISHLQLTSDFDVIRFDEETTIFQLIGNGTEMAIDLTSSCSTIQNMTICPYDTLFEEMSTLELIMNSSFIQDCSNSPLFINEISSPPLLESSPTCSECGDGMYVSLKCDEVYDRECATCSTCPTGYYAIKNCSTYHDTECASEI